MCQHTHSVKFGKDSKGNQKFRCKLCGKIKVINPHSPRLTEEKKQLIEKLLKENLSIRGIARVIGCEHTTILNFLRKKKQSS